MRAVFDLDDTISVHKNRDFANALPIIETIERIRALKRDGWEIVVYSARGQNSCKGDLKLIEERNREQVETWLREHNVPFDELRFGNPLGDLYVDDKGVSLEDFLQEDYGPLKGNSGATIYRAGKKVIKQSKDAKQQAEWYRTAAAIGARVPRVQSIVLDTITMEYIDGDPGEKTEIGRGLLYAIISTVMMFSLMKDGYSFDVEALKERATEHLKSAGAEGKFGKLYDFLDSNAEKYRAEASFCHGDLSLSNMIRYDDEMYLIDPIVKEEYSSYLMDFAKLRFSLDGGETFLHGEDIDRRETLKIYDGILKESRVEDLVVALEAVYWIRLLKYTAEPERKAMAVEKAKELEERL